MRKVFCFFALVAIAMSACTKVETLERNYVMEGVENLHYPDFFTAYMSGEDIQTKTSYAFADGTLTTSWSVGDKIAVSAAALSSYAMIYNCTDFSGGTATFAKESGYMGSASVYGLYYPGNSIKSDVQFMNFTYSGQVQSASDPTAHMAAYHTMRKILSSFADQSSIDFSSAESSSCMRFSLSGMTFQNPSNINISVIRGGFVAPVLYLNNHLGSYYGDSGASYNGLKEASSLSLGLSGYSSESSLTAFMMMSNRSVSLKSGDKVRVKVSCSDGTYYKDLAVGSDMTLPGGYCHSIVVNGGWTKLAASPDYSSHPEDGQVVTLQTASVGNGVDVVLMGDGFVYEDITGGTYATVMNKMYTELFTVEPYKSFKTSFNVYYVNAISPERVNASSIGLNGAVGSGSETKFSSTLTDGSTSMSGNSSLVREYAKLALGANAAARIENATVVVAVNVAAHAGTCHTSWGTVSDDYGHANAVVYLACGKNEENFIQLVHHEVNGHGIGKLADEYYSNGHYTDPSSLWSELASQQAIGLFRNVDKYVAGTTTTSDVLWSDLFGTANNYETVEALGVFAGGNARSLDFCRPTEDGYKSIMYRNRGIFNAICRRQIIYRIKHLTGVYADSQLWGVDRDDFLSWDAANFIPHISTYLPSSVRRLNYVEEIPMSTPPVLHQGQWIDGHFIEAAELR